MGRKTWVMPMTLVQKFEANEAVAADQCFEIGCQSTTYGSSIAWDSVRGTDNHPLEDGAYPWTQKEYYGGISRYDKANHDGCHDPSDNIFNFDGENLTFVGNSGQVGNGKLDIIIDASGDGILGNAGDRVYWHTTERYMSTNMVWNHWGTLVAISDGHPLRS